MSGYMAACWKQLSQQKGVQLRVIAWESTPNGDHDSFDSSMMNTINCRLLSKVEQSTSGVADREIQAFDPDVVIIPGWISSGYTESILKLSVIRPRVVMGMDTPWKGSVRQHFTTWRFHGLFQKVDHVVVAGERTWQYAKRIGFQESQISRGVYGWDSSCFTSPVNSMRKDTLPRSFVFVGRFVEEKGLTTLLKSYRHYRKTVDCPWPITMCGSGPLNDMVQGEGIRKSGFVQPRDLPQVLNDSSVFVLPSHYEPWGVALAEAMGAGLPVIASEACGAAIDLVRPYWNGLLVPTASVNALAESLIWFHEHADCVNDMGINARKAAEPYSSENWGVRWKAILDNVVRRRAA